MTSTNNIENGIINYLMEISPEVLKRFRGSHEITQKIDNSIVTDSDKNIEVLLKNKFSNLLPNSYFLGEESSDMTPEQYSKIFDHDYIWAIDPIDGTKNFAHGIPIFAVSVGLLKKEEGGHKPVAGAVLFPALNEIVYTKNGKSYSMIVDKREERELEMPKSQDSIVALSDSFYKEYDFNSKATKAQPRQLGSTVVNIAYTAIGRSIGTMTAAHLWDFAGGLAIAQNLGVDMRKFSDGTVKNKFGINDFIIGNPDKDWRMKEMYILSTEKNYALMKQIMIQKQ
jgi:myo-inositol-1(or 4)-monophosphatase